jgi:hypothetical protein
MSAIEGNAPPDIVSLGVGVQFDKGFERRRTGRTGAARQDPGGVTEPKAQIRWLGVETAHSIAQEYQSERSE